MVALYVIAFVAQPDAVLGIVQKIFYMHVGTAFAMSLAMVCGALASLVDLVRPDDRVDAFARACIEAGLLFAGCVLTSGPLWARKSWGAWWTWEPRLTLTLLLFLLAIAVLAVRALTADEQLGRRVSAAIAVVAGPTAFLIRKAVAWWGGNHPIVIEGGGIQSPEMRMAFGFAAAAILLSGAVLVAFRYRGLRLAQRMRALGLGLDAIRLRRQRARGSGLAPTAAVVLALCLPAGAAVSVVVSPRTSLAAQPETGGGPAARAAEAPAAEAPAGGGDAATPRDLSRYKERDVSGGGLLVAAYMVFWTLVFVWVARTVWQQARVSARITELEEAIADTHHDEAA
jgi:heme exporter protein C